MNTITHIIPKLTAEQKELVRDVLGKRVKLEHLADSRKDLAPTRPPILKLQHDDGTFTRITRTGRLTKIPKKIKRYDSRWQTPSAMLSCV